MCQLPRDRFALESQAFDPSKIVVVFGLGKVSLQ
jgi:hypothetical protein